MGFVFAERLGQAVRRAGNPCVIGLDPRPERLPREIFSDPDKVIPAIEEFHHVVLSEAAGLVPCVKPQVAFFEALGPAGYDLFTRTCSEARGLGYMVIGDVKRGDIGSTAEAYARAHFAYCDALTINPYLGTDSVAPFLKWCKESAKGVFVLVRTSNKGNEFQPLQTGEGTLADAVGAAVTRWNADMPRDAEGRYGPVGAVVGATHPGEIPHFRALLRDSWILLPGYGAQGATAADLGGAFDERGLGALVNSSRGITACFDPQDPSWKEAVKNAILQFREDLSRALGG